jgi:hypothetical protein
VYGAWVEKETQEAVAALYHSGLPSVELYPCCPATGEAGRVAVVQVVLTNPPKEPEAAMFTAFVIYALLAKKPWKY